MPNTQKRGEGIGVPRYVRFYDSTFAERKERVREWARLASGKYVVLVCQRQYVESYWFDDKGENPKSYLEFTKQI